MLLLPQMPRLNGENDMRSIALIFLLLTLAFPAYAVQPDEVLPNAAMESRARHISTGLRCLVCQNESIDDSDAPLARDLRLLVRDRLKAGDSNEDVERFVVDRYGEFVLLKPVFGMHTMLLWFSPVIFLLLGGFFVFRRFSVKLDDESKGLSSSERAMIADLTDDGHA